MKHRTENKKKLSVPRVHSSQMLRYIKPKKKGRKEGSEKKAKRKRKRKRKEDRQKNIEKASDSANSAALLTEKDKGRERGTEKKTEHHPSLRRVLSDMKRGGGRITKSSPTNIDTHIRTRPHNTAASKRPAPNTPLSDNHPPPPVAGRHPFTAC